MNTFTAVIKEVDDWWVGWIEEIPGVNCQEKTRQELMKSLEITLREALEFNKQEAITQAGYNYFEEKAKKGNWGKFTKVLNKVSDREPESYDKL